MKIRLNRIGVREIGRALLVLGCLATFAAHSTTNAQEVKKPKTILVLYWYGREFAGNVRLDNNIREVLNSQPPGTVEYYPEYLESNRFPGERQSLFFRDYLMRKYADHRIDVVVTVSPVALNFVLKYCKDLFANTPIVYQTIGPPSLDKQVHPAGMTGVVSDQVMARSLDLALKLHPSAREALVVVGTSEHDDQYVKDLQDELRPFESRIPITYLCDLPLDELLTKVREAPTDSVIFYVRYSLDEPGKSIDPFEALSLISQAARVPIYSIGSLLLLGRGTVGGYSSDNEIGEKTLIRMALEVANGKDPNSLPEFVTPNVIRFDSNQLRRWGIAESRLPPHSIVLFKQATFWQLYKWRIVSVATLITVQTLLIVGLLVERSRRRRAAAGQRETQERNRAILNAMPDLMFLQDKDGLYLDYHARSADLLLVPPEKFVGKSMYDVLPSSLAAELTRRFERAIDTRETQVFEYDLAVNGKRQWFEARIAPCDGNKLLSVVRDVTKRKDSENELRSSEERFSKVFAASPQPMSLTTLDEGRYLDVNNSFLEMSGYRRAEVIGRTSLELGIFETLEQRNRLIDPLRKSGEVQNLEIEFRTKCDDVRTLLSSAELIELGGERCVLVASSDITERKRLEQQLQRSEREFSTLVKNSPDVISRLDRNLRYTYVSPVLESVSALGPESFLGKTPGEVDLPDYDWRSFEAVCRAALKTRQTAAREFQYHDCHYRTRVIPEFGVDGRVESLMAISEDVTERIRAEQELRKLTARLFSLQDEERRRIARELHDGAAQNIFGITVSLANLQRQKGNSDADSTRTIDECQAMAEQSLTELRTLSYLLHPPILDHAGLVLALQWYVEGFIKRSGVHVDLITLEEIGRLPLEIETALFRIVQESLTNIRRHSGSATASIRLEKNTEEVKLEISDQGHGITENGHRSLTDGVVELGVGIPGMRQRLIQLGGRLEIESSEKGTTIVAVVPTPGGISHDKHLTG